ncbi:hypothetical protein BH23ACT5_BH23ACT5_07420 [soil metagenome]
MATAAAGNVARMRGFLQWVGALVIVGALLFYGAGGWYFSNELIADAFEVSISEPEEHVRVVGVDGTMIELQEATGSDSDLERDGEYGLRWDGGYARVGDILERGSTISRSFSAQFGAEPGLGQLVAVDAAAYPDDPGTAFGAEWETITFDAGLGEMEAWLIPGSDDSWVVHVHGKGATRSEALRGVGSFIDDGLSQLVISYRNDEGGPFDPSGHYQYGVTEWEDLAAAVDLAVAGGAESVVLFGYSTGAAIALSYLEQAPGDEVVVGAVFDAPNVDFAATVNFNASQRTLPFTEVPVPRSLAWVARTITTFRIGVDWSAIDYVERADQLSVPILVFHGSDDSTVPIETSRRLAGASDRVELIEVFGAEHVRSWNVDSEAYESAVNGAVAAMLPDS